ncbi:MAG: HEAT repeat domain-containing protein [Leptospira sp.]|nr:HEAT repeat domain-containing protein [Leptospira sp.]
MNGAAEEKDELKEKLFKGGKNQREAIASIKILGREDLIKNVQSILRGREEPEEETVNSVVSLYRSYDDDIEKMVPGWTEDLEWILQNSRRETDYFSIFSFMETRKEKRLFYPVAAFIKYPFYPVRAAAFKALASLNDDRFIPYILELGNSDESIFRFYYLESLSYFRDERVISLLSKTIADPRPALRSESISLVERLNLKNKFFQVVNMATGDPNYEVRKQAVISSKDFYSRNRTSVFQRTLFDENQEVRRATVEAINVIKDQYYSRFVSQQLEREKVSDLRLSMIDTLLAIGNHGGGTGLAMTLKDEPNSEVRVRSAFAIGKLGASSAIPALLSSLKNDSAISVRIESAHSTGLLKEKSAVPILLSIMKQDSEPAELRKEAIRAVDLINDTMAMPAIFDQLDVEQKPEVKALLKETLRDMLYRHHGPKQRK